jgi:hypothetical protein
MTTTAQPANPPHDRWFARRARDTTLPTPSKLDGLVSLQTIG